MPKREIRVVLLGEAGIGKSALVVRFITGRFLHKYDPTLGKYAAATDSLQLCVE